jgi:vacuolar protein sorting-associated protein 3
MGNHRSALVTLVRGLRDSTSAEAYCTLGGEVVPAKTAQVIGEQYDLQLWASTLFAIPIAAAAATSGSTAAKSPASRPPAVCRQKSTSGDLKRKLLRILLEVYMSDGFVLVLNPSKYVFLTPVLYRDASRTERTARLLNSQAMNLDVYDVINVIIVPCSVSLIDDKLSGPYPCSAGMASEHDVFLSRTFVS